MPDIAYEPTAEERLASIERDLSEAEAHRAEGRRADAEARKLDQEALVHAASVAQQEATAKMAVLAYDEQLKMQRETEARDWEHGKFKFLTPVSAESVNKMIDRLSLFSRLHPGEDIELLFNSPGGSVFDGMALFDHLQELRANGHKVTTRTWGMAASMAGILLQAGDERVAGREAWVLIHEISTMAWGKSSEIEDELELIKRLQARVIDIFVRRSKEAVAAGTASKQLTPGLIKSNWKRKDWWFSSDECLTYGIVDAIR